MVTDFSDCLMLNTIMAARALTRRYDVRLKHLGISVAQFSVMMTLRSSDHQPVARMAERIAMDRTTLLRNLELLSRKGLVQAEPAAKGRGRVFTLTAEGDVLLDRAIPHWHSARAELQTLLKDNDPDGYLNALRKLTAG